MTTMVMLENLLPLYGETMTLAKFYKVIQEFEDTEYILLSENLEFDPETLLLDIAQDIYMPTKFKF